MRKQVIEVLATFGTAAQPAVSTLGRLLGDPKPDVKRAAAEALGKLGITAAAAAPALVTALRDPEIAEQAEKALLRLGPLAASAMMDVLEKSNNVSIKLKLISLLEKTGKDAKGILPGLDAIANSDSIPSVRRAASQAADEIRKKQ